MCVLAPLGASSVSLVGFGVPFWVQMSCCCDASLLWSGGSVSVLEKFDNFFKACSVRSVDHASD